MTKKTRQAFINQAVHNMKQSVKILGKKNYQPNTILWKAK